MHMNRFCPEEQVFFCPTALAKRYCATISTGFLAPTGGRQIGAGHKSPKKRARCLARGTNRDFASRQVTEHGRARDGTAPARATWIDFVADQFLVSSVIVS